MTEHEAQRQCILCNMTRLFQNLNFKLRHIRQRSPAV